MRLIDADKLVAELQKKPIHDGHFIHTRDVSDAIFNAPTISPDEVRGVGKWTRHVLKSANTPWGYDCSACGEWFVIGDDTAERYNYCPNCGAKMEVSEDA